VEAPLAMVTPVEINWWALLSAGMAQSLAIICMAQ
jgi:hypothetical protein